MHMSKRVYLTTSNLQAKTEKIYIYTQFFRPSGEPDRSTFDALLAQFHILTSNQSFRAFLKRKHVNKQIAFNKDFINRLESVFAGKFSNLLITNIQDHGFDGKILVVGSQLELRSIRVILFEVPLQEIQEKPFALVRKLMNSVHQQKQLTLACLKAKQEKERQKLDEIEQVNKQLKQNYKDETNMIKQKFIPVINEAKKKLVKCFGLDVNFNKESQQEQKLRKANQNLSYQRQFYKINANLVSKPSQNQNKNCVQDLFGIEN